MASYNWFGLYLSEVGREFQVQVSPSLLQRRRQVLARFASDFMLNHLIFGPLNIAAWRGVWGYAFYYFTLVSSSVLYRVTHLLGKNLPLTWFRQLAGRYCSCLLPRQDGGTSQIQVKGRFLPSRCVTLYIY